MITHPPLPPARLATIGQPAASARRVTIAPAAAEARHG
jgi:hypothetical protein